LSSRASSKIIQSTLSEFFKDWKFTENSLMAEPLQKKIAWLGSCRGLSALGTLSSGGGNFRTQKCTPSTRPMSVQAPTISRSITSMRWA
jgi:hypothetical protein